MVTSHGFKTGALRKDFALKGVRIGPGCDVYTLALWLLGTGTRRTLERVAFDYGDEVEPEFLELFLEEVSGTMKYLRIGASGMHQSSAGEFTLRVSALHYCWPFFSWHCFLL